MADGFRGGDVSRILSAVMYSDNSEPDEASRWEWYAMARASANVAAKLAMQRSRMIRLIVLIKSEVCRVAVIAFLESQI